MTKIENKGQVVKKEIFKLTLADEINLKNTDNLSKDTLDILNKLDDFLSRGRLGRATGFLDRDVKAFAPTGRMQ